MKELKLPDKGRFRTATTRCKICDQPVRYYIKNFTTGKNRRVPPTHGGQCQIIHEIELVHKKVHFNNRKRERSAAAEMQMRIAV